MSDSAHHAIQTSDPLYLFFCRVRCLRLGDPRACEELKRAASHPSCDIRVAANAFLTEIRALQAQVAMPVEDACAD